MGKLVCSLHRLLQQSLCYASPLSKDVREFALVHSQGHWVEGWQGDRS